MSELLELAERCEQATGPDGELDYSILERHDPQRFDYCSKDYDELCARLKKKGLWDARKSSAYAHAFAGTPRYTASIDAAMTLVPEGMIVALTNCGVDDPHSPNMGRATAIVGKDSDTASKPVEAASIPLALCAAALRARAAQ